MEGDIDYEFAEFVSKNYQRLSENQKKLCREMGLVASL